MKIKMAASPRSPEQAERSYWAVSVIRAFGIVQILAATALSFFFLRPVLQVVLYDWNYDMAVIFSTIISVLVGLGAGFISSALIFAVTKAMDDLHTIRGYLRDMTVTGQYYDE